MIYAPILIPTLCRADHFIKQIESLKLNSWAKYTDVYIGLDYPIKESHKEGFNRICEYLNGSFDEFSSFNVIKRSQNLGSIRNGLELIERIIDSNRYDRFIYAEDDCSFSPNFLEYMDKSLEAYKDDSSVIAVTGYVYPFSYDVKPGCSAFKNMVSLPIWGTGFWVNSYREMKHKIESKYLKYKFLETHSIKSKISNARYIDFMRDSLTKNQNCILYMPTDIAMSCYIQFEKLYVITPVLSLVRNGGFDGSGVYCQEVRKTDSKVQDARNYDYSSQIIDEKESFDLIVDEESNQKINLDRYNTFDSRTKLEIIRADIKGKLKKTAYRLKLYNAI